MPDKNAIYLRSFSAHVLETSECLTTAESANQTFMGLPSTARRYAFYELITQQPTAPIILAGDFRQVGLWLIPLADETQSVQVKL